MTDKSETIIAEMARELERRIDIRIDGPREIALACWAVVERRCAAAREAAEAAGPAMPGRQDRIAELERQLAEADEMVFKADFPPLDEREVRLVFEAEDRHSSRQPKEPTP